VEMLAFEAAMLAFAMAGNFILLFIAWEFLSLMSYLLIGFWHYKERATSAARKTITIVLIGDVCLLASIIILQSAFGTLTFSDIISQLNSVQVPGVVGILLVIAIATKSAQFPFHEWLPDAMEGPTPVSAYLHSTTMVKAGVFAAIVLFPILQATNSMPLLFTLGTITALYGMFSAMQETHVKKVLAYSTMQEIGLMLAAVSVNALLAATYFFFAQSFYKALLFFSSGVVMKANEKENLNELSGIRRNRLVYVATLLGILALAGFVPFDGFFAGIGISSTFANDPFVYLLMSLISLGTSFYIFRWFLLQDKRASNPRIMLNYNSVPNSMTYGMVLLAIMTVVASAAFFLFPDILSGVEVISMSVNQAPGLMDAAIETVLVAVGAFVCYRIYKQPKAAANAKSKPAARIPERSYKFMHTGKTFNDVYSGVADIVYLFAGGALMFDAFLGDFFDWIGHITMKSGLVVRRLAAGGINSYITVFVIGLILVLIAAFVIK
jgi:NADH-quinone oxidoreductase subunit L